MLTLHIFHLFLKIHVLTQCSFSLVAETVVLQCHTAIGCRHELQNFHVEVRDSETGHRCLWPCSVCKHGKRHTGLHSAWWKYYTAHHQEPRLSFYSGSPDTEHRHECHAARPVSSLNTHAQSHSHTQRACYKNIQVSPSLADGCYYGNTVANREHVWVGLHQWAGNPAEVNQSRQQRCLASSSRALLLHGWNVHSMEPDVLRNISHCWCVRRTHSDLGHLGFLDSVLLVLFKSVFASLRLNNQLLLQKHWHVLEGKGNTDIIWLKFLPFVQDIEVFQHHPLNAFPNPRVTGLLQQCTRNK